jgi:hypothetical protein
MAGHMTPALKQNVVMVESGKPASRALLLLYFRNIRISFAQITVFEMNVIMGQACDLLTCPSYLHLPQTESPGDFVAPTFHAGAPFVLFILGLSGAIGPHAEVRGSEDQFIPLLFLF